MRIRPISGDSLRSIAGLRDVLIHKYFGVDYRNVWKIVKEDLPDLMLRPLKIEGRKMSGFKQTEIGLIPEDWEVMRLGEIIVYKKGKNQECYLMRGKTVFCHT